MTKVYLPVGHHVARSFVELADVTGSRVVVNVLAPYRDPEYPKYPSTSTSAPPIEKHIQSQGVDPGVQGILSA